MSLKILITAAVLPFCLLLSCQDPVGSLLPESRTMETVEYVEGSSGEKYDPVLEDFARTLAASMADATMRKMVKDEANKMFDGDYDILVQHIRHQSVGATFERTMQAATQKVSSSARTKAFVLDEYTNKQPLLNISVPVHIDKWNTSAYEPLVAISPTINDEYKVKFIKAYDSKGKVYWLSTRGTPDQPVVVVGLNERVRMDATGQMKLKNNLVSFSKATKRTIPLMPMHLQEPGDDGGGGGPGPNTSCPFEDDKQLQIPRLEVNNIEPFETWDRGLPEICLESYGINPSTNTERKFRRFIWLGQNNAFQQPSPWMGFGYSPYRSYDISALETWHTSLFGSELAFKFWEEDSGGTDASSSLKLGPITITVNFGAGDDEIGDLWLYRCGDNYIYQNQGQYFKTLQSRGQNFWIFFQTV